MSTSSDPNGGGGLPDEREPGDGSGESDSPEASTSLSRFALRDDGALLVSLDDAAERDITGREVVTFLLLTAEEAARVRVSAEEALSDAAAKVLGRLPRRAK